MFSWTWLQICPLWKYFQVLLIWLASRHRSKISSCLAAVAFDEELITIPSSFLLQRNMCPYSSRHQSGVHLPTSRHRERVATRFTLGYCRQFLEFSWISEYTEIEMKDWWQVVPQEEGNFNRWLFNALCLEVSGGSTCKELEKQISWGKASAYWIGF